MTGLFLRHPVDVDRLFERIDSGSSFFRPYTVYRYVVPVQQYRMWNTRIAFGFEVHQCGKNKSENQLDH
jgi:hypothetical protein